MGRYLITLQVPDRTGLVEQIANAVNHHGGNWLDSELRHIDGIFAAILLLEVDNQHWDDLIDALELIDGMSLTHAQAGLQAKAHKHLTLSLVAYDRPGLVKEISNKASSLGINIERFSSKFESASHTGIALFRATISLTLTDDQQETLLTEALYAIGDDVVIDKLRSKQN